MSADIIAFPKPPGPPTRRIDEAFLALDKIRQIASAIVAAESPYTVGVLTLVLAIEREVGRVKSALDYR